MKTSMYFLFFMVCTNVSIAQDVRGVQYEISRIVFEKDNSLDFTYTNLIFDDSLMYMYQYHMNTTKDPYKKELVYGRKLVDQAVYFNSSNGEHAKAIVHSKKDQQLVIAAKRKAINWEILPYQKEILGKKCVAALAFNSKKDSILAYYTIELPYHFGPGLSQGLPGLVLEYFDQGLNTHFLANKLIYGDYRIEWPRDVKIIRKAEK